MILPMKALRLAAVCWLGITTSLGAEVVVRISGEEFTHQVLEVGQQVWLATEEGAYRVDGNSLTPVLEGQPVTALAEVDGLPWLGTERGLFRFEGNQLVAALQGSVGDRWVRCILVTDQDVWLGTHEGLFRVRSGAATRFLDRHLINQIKKIGSGIWVATNKNAYHFEPSGAMVEQLDQSREVAEVVDAGGYIWLITNITLGRFGPLIQVDGNHQAVVQVPDKAEVISVADIDGEAWFATTGGVFRYVSGVLQPVAVEGLAEPVNTITVVDDRVWLGTTHRAFRKSGGRFSPVPPAAQKINIKRIAEVGGETWLWGEHGAYRVDKDVDLLVRPSTQPFPIRHLLFGKVAKIQEARYDFDGEDPYSDSIHREFKVIMQADRLKFEREIEKRESSPTASLERQVPYGLHELYLIAYDSFGNTTGRLTIPILAVPGPFALGILWAGFLWFLAIFVLVVAPRYKPAMSMIMFPTVIRWASSLFLAPLALSLAFVRRHLLSRYRRELVALGKQSGWTDTSGLPILKTSLEDELAEHRRVLLVGEPADTRRYLRFSACQLADNPRRTLAKTIPVFLRLELYAENLEEGIKSQLADIGGITESTLASSFLNHGGFVFLLDGLGLLDQKGVKAVDKFINSYRRRNLFIVGTGHGTVALDGIEARVHLSPPSEQTDESLDGGLEGNGSQLSKNQS